MRLTRHARNRLRWIARRYPAVSEATLLETIHQAVTRDYDDGGNRRAGVIVGTIRLIVVIDEAQDAIVTLWVK